MPPAEDLARYGDAIRALAVTVEAQGLDALAVAASEALERERVPHLVIRGPAIAAALYDDLAERPYADVDLLVPPDRRPGAERLLRGLGLRPVLEGSAASEQPVHATNFAGEAGMVDLHTSIQGTGAAPGIVWTVLGRGARQLDLRDGTVPVPSLPALALVVALHAAQHGPQRPVPHEDVRRAAQRLPDAVWREACGLATELGATGWFAAGLNAVPEGAALRERLGLRDVIDVDAAIRAEGDQPTIRGVAAVRDAPGLAAKLRLLLRELFPSPAFMRYWRPLGRRPGGLVLLYAYRPLWLLWHLPSGVRAYLRAVRRASRDAGA